MTYKDVYDKFMIEYDKADISSSYPSLTIYEVATLLDKAMLALIAQKVTGNNPRKSVLDIDTKSAMDLSPLFVCKELQSGSQKGDFENEYKWAFADTDLLYLLKVYINIMLNDDDEDGHTEINDIITIIPRAISDKFKKTRTNVPWMKHPVAYLDHDYLHVFFDSDIISKSNNIQGTKLKYEYIKKPNSFVDIFKNTNENNTQFVLSDTMCEELINLAIIFACRNVENPRISTEIQTKSLEA